MSQMGDESPAGRPNAATFGDRTIGMPIAVRDDHSGTVVGSNAFPNVRFRRQHKPTTALRLVCYRDAECPTHNGRERES
jgi:hypothetical protein